MNIQRIKKLQSVLENPILIKKKENLLYLTGRAFDYRAEEYLLVKKKDVVGFGSGLEKISWAKRADRFKNIGKYILRNQTLELFGEFTYAEVKYIRVKNPGLKIKIRTEHSPVDYQRMTKEPGEIALVKKSMQIVEKVFREARREIKKSGMTEIKLAQFIQKRGLELGAEDISFPAIVASGPNAAMPHHFSSPRRLRAGESIIIDFGFKYKNYCSDFTRTVFLKKVPKKLEVAYNQVDKAYNESIKFINGKITGNDLYQKAVDVLAEKKLDKYFIHSLGHGTGLEIHELPNLSPKSKDEFKNGMVFSIEPGVYIPKLGGIRIEDLVYLDSGQVKKFIHLSTSLQENVL